MKIIILHGEHTIKAYERLAKFKEAARKRNWKVVQINSDDGISKVLRSQSLFAEKNLYIFESLDKMKKPEFDWLKKNAKNFDSTLIFYKKGKISKTILNKLPRPEKIEEFDPPRLLWKFLDSIYLGNTNQSVLLLHKVLKKEPVELIFTLIVKTFRDMYWVSTDADTLDYPPWRKTKLKMQASKFTKEQLKGIIGSLAEIDIKAKTSKVNLTDSLDFLILTELE